MGCVEECIFIIENYRRCLRRFVDTFVKKKIGSSSEVTAPKRCRPATSAKISCDATSSTSKLISTKPRKKGIGPTLPSGNCSPTQRIQLRCGPEGFGIRCIGGQRTTFLAHLRQQGDGVLAFADDSDQLLCSVTDVVVVGSRLLQKHNKKLFDMCNLGEEFHLGAKRN